jgi:cytochrome c oxidase subunit 4
MTVAGDKSHHHILPLRVYFGVALALLVLTIITVIVAQFHFGEYNLLIAMIIAAFKASLVALFFMHLKYDNRIYMAVFVGSLIFLAVFITLTMFDTLRRDDIYDEVAHPLKNARIYDNMPAADSLHAAPDSLHSTESSAPAGH